MAAQGAFGTDFYDRSILRPNHRAYYRSGRPVIKISPKGALGSHEIRPIHSAPSLGQSINTRLQQPKPMCDIYIYLLLKDIGIKLVKVYPLQSHLGFSAGVRSLASAWVRSSPKLDFSLQLKNTVRLQGLYLRRFLWRCEMQGCLPLSNGPGCQSGYDAGLTINQTSLVRFLSPLIFSQFHVILIRSLSGSEPTIIWRSHYNISKIVL